MLRLFPVLTASLAVLLGTLRLAEGQTGTFSGKPDEKYGNNCCSAFTAECESCAAGFSEEEYCKRNPYTSGCEKYRNCCHAYNAKCQSCAAGLSEEEYCKRNPYTSGCEKYRNCCHAYNAKCQSCAAGLSE